MKIRLGLVLAALIAVLARSASALEGCVSSSFQFSPDSKIFEIVLKNRGNPAEELHLLASDFTLSSQSVIGPKQWVKHFTHSLQLPDETALNFAVTIESSPTIDQIGCLTGFEVTVPGISDSSYYLAYVNYPDIRIVSPGSGYKFYSNWNGGLVFTDPVLNGLTLNGFSDPGPWSSPAMGYVNPEGRMLYISNTDTTGIIKLISAESVESTFHLSYRQHHPNPLSSEATTAAHFRSQFEVELSVLSQENRSADVFDLAGRYRTFLQASDTKYPPLLGSEGDKRASVLDDLLWVGTIQQVGEFDDNCSQATIPFNGEVLTYDLNVLNLMRESLDISNSLGGHGLAIFYNTNCRPNYDFHADWYRSSASDSYFNPGISGWNEAQQLAEDSQSEGEPLVTAIPYVQGSSGHNPYQDGRIPLSQHEIDMGGALMQDEFGNFIGSDFGNVELRALSMRSPWWRKESVDYMLSVMNDFAHSDGAYLDFYLTTYLDWSPHLPGVRGDPAAQFSGQMNQLREIRKQSTKPLVFPMEYIVGRAAAEVDVMFKDPFQHFVPNFPKQFIHSTPQFALEYPGVPLGILAVDGPAGAPLQGWQAFSKTVAMIQFKELYSTGSYMTDYDLQGGWFKNSSIEYRDYLSAIGAIFKKQGFQPYHQGTLERTPLVTQSPQADFSNFPLSSNPAHPLNELIGNVSASTLIAPQEPSIFPHAMFKHRSGSQSHAFIIANPWIDISQFASNEDLDASSYEVSIQLQEYGYNYDTDLRVVTPDGTVASQCLRADERYSISRELPRGEINVAFFTQRDPAVKEQLEGLLSESTASAAALTKSVKKLKRRIKATRAAIRSTLELDSTKLIRQLKKLKKRITLKRMRLLQANEMTEQIQAQLAALIC